MRVPVLCYHRIEEPPSRATLDSNFVTPNQFAAHVRMLASWGCVGVTVGDIARWQRGDQTLPPRAVAITFDDAYVSVADNALPILAAHGWSSTVYVVSAHVGGSNAWDPGSPRGTILDRNALRSMQQMGVDIGSHTRHHTRIRGLDDAQALDELRGSRLELESMLGGPVESFAFPYGSHGRRSLAMVAEAGYRSATTLKRWANGKGTNPLRLGRISVGGPLPAWQLKLKMLKMMLTPARG